MVRDRRRPHSSVRDELTYARDDIYAKIFEEAWSGRTTPVQEPDRALPEVADDRQTAFERAWGKGQEVEGQAQEHDLDVER